MWGGGRGEGASAGYRPSCLLPPAPPPMVETVFNLILERWAIFTMMPFFYSFQRSLCFWWPFRNIYLNPLEVFGNNSPNRPFPTTNKFALQNVDKCKTFLGRMSYLHENKRIIFLSVASQFTSFWNRSLGQLVDSLLICTTKRTELILVDVQKKSPPAIGLREIFCQGGR